MALHHTLEKANIVLVEVGWCMEMIEMPLGAYRRTTTAFN